MTLEQVICYRSALQYHALLCREMYIDPRSDYWYRVILHDRDGWKLFKGFQEYYGRK